MCRIFGRISGFFVLLIRFGQYGMKFGKRVIKTLYGPDFLTASPSGISSSA